MRTAALAALIAVLPTSVAAQVGAIPSRLVEVEVERSRTCVGTLARISVLDEVLQPLVTRGTRLRQIAEAVAIEDRSAVDPFDGADETEVLVRDWFTTDAALAQRYITSEDAGLLAERQAGRETIKTVVTDALVSVQATADSVLSANTELIQSAGPCDGAIFVQAGAGIVADSDPALEFEETRNKARALEQAIQLAARELL